MKSGPLASLRRTLRNTSWGQRIRNDQTRQLPKNQPTASSHQSPRFSGRPEPSSPTLPAAAGPSAEPTEAGHEQPPSEASAPGAGSEPEKAPSEDLSVNVLPLAPPFPPRLQKLAAANPGGWVYDVEGKVRARQPVPVERVLGAWQIDEHGVPTGEYVANLPPSRPLPTRARWGWRLGALAALAVVIAAIVLGVFLSSSTKQASRAGPGQSSSLGRPGQATVVPTRRRPRPSARRPARVHHRPVLVPPIAGVHLEVSALARVWVCVQDARGRLPIDGMVLTAGGPPIRLVSRSFRLYPGNTSVAVRVNGTLQSLAASSGPIAYLVTSQGIKALTDTNPPCG